MSNSGDGTSDAPTPTDRRLAVMTSALATFARFGFRKTSMEQVATAARISRPGLYFLFASKEELFRAAVGQSLDDDLSEVGRILDERDRALADRLLDSFDCWAGRYVGPIARDITTVIDDNPGLLGDLVVTAPGRFADLIVGAVAAEVGPGNAEAAPIAQTLISTSIGIKHQVSDRAAYVDRMRIAIALLVRTPTPN